VHAYCGGVTTGKGNLQRTGHDPAGLSFLGIFVIGAKVLLIKSANSDTAVVSDLPPRPEMCSRRTLRSSLELHSETDSCGAVDTAMKIVMAVRPTTLGFPRKFFDCPLG